MSDHAAPPRPIPAPHDAVGAGTLTGSAAGHGLGSPFLHLCGRHVLDVGGYVPAVPERVLELPRSIAVELVFHGPDLGGPGPEGGGERLVHVLDVDHHGDRRPAQSLGARGTHAGKLVPSISTESPISNSACP